MTTRPLLIFDLDGTISDPAVRPLDYSFRQIAPSAPNDAILAMVATYRERYAEVGYAENVV